MSIDERTRAAIEAADTDELLRVVDGMCDSRRWDDMLMLRTYCADAVERGKQVWAIDEHIRYRLALEGPAELAAEVVDEGPARFTLGPLTEVVAQAHTWAELNAHLVSPQSRALVAHERARRGETIDEDAIDGEVLGIPATRQPWEPHYETASYKSDRAEFPSPPVPTDFRTVDSSGVRIDDPDTEEALHALIMPWIDQSSGTYRIAATEGSAGSAVAAVGRELEVAAMEPAAAMAHMVWAAASGGAHGRRRGLATGRFLTWWALAAMLDVEPTAEAIGAGVEAMEFGWFSLEPTEGWNLRLVVSSPPLSWAIDAHDEREEEVDGQALE